MMNGITEIAESVSSELKHRLPKQRKTKRTKLALLVSTMLEVRSANLMDLAAGLPRDADRTDMRYQWIIRLLGNPLVISDAVIEPFAREVLERAAAELDPGSIQDVGPPPGADARGALGRAGPAAGVAGRGDRGRDRVRHPAGAARGGRPLVARRGQRPAAGRPLLWYRRPDRLVPGARLGLSPASEGQPRGVRRHRQDDDRAVRQRPGLLSRRCRTHRSAGAHPHRHHPGPGPRRALDHRHVRETRLSADP